MPDFLEDKSEKKVRYIELIYDLMFVYLVSRNADLLEIHRGFLTLERYGLYLVSTLVILQIWYASTLFINRCGAGSLSEYAGLFVNMFLLYIMGQGIRMNWSVSFYPYTGAWALILLNLALQYFLSLRKRSADAWERRHDRDHGLMLLAEAAVVLLTMPVYALTGVALTPVALLFGFSAGLITRRSDALVPVDFPHLAERVMLYVVFTFGEMLLGIAGYFGNGFGARALYFALMAFLIVAGLFSGYGWFYEKLLDSARPTAGHGYMLLHIVMVLALNNITAALEFMRMEAVPDLPKTVFLVGSILVYYGTLLLTQRFSERHLATGRAYAWIATGFAAFCGLMALLYRRPMASIAVTVIFIFAQLAAIRWGGQKREK